MKGQKKSSSSHLLSLDLIKPSLPKQNRNIESISKYLPKTELQKIDLSLLIKTKEYQNNLQFQQIVKVLQSYNQSLAVPSKNNTIVKHEVLRQIFLQISQISILEQHLKAPYINQVYSQMDYHKENGLRLNYDSRIKTKKSIYKDQHIHKQNNSLRKSTKSIQLNHLQIRNFSKDAIQKKTNIGSCKTIVFNKEKYILNRQKSHLLKPITINYQQSEYKKQKTRKEESFCRSTDIFKMIKYRYESMIATPFQSEKEMAEIQQKVKQQQLRTKISKTNRLNLFHPSLQLNYLFSSQKESADLDNITGLTLLNQSLALTFK